MPKGNSVSKRINNIKNNLENAEQSFLQNKDIRGELDLMLAEAELNNLRRKKDVPWVWNRHILALGIAVLLVVSCFGGWYYAKNNIKADTSSVHLKNTVDNSVQNMQTITKAIVKPEEKNIQIQAKSDTINNNHENSTLSTNNKPLVSDTDMRNLVKSARSELTSPK